MTGKRLCLVIQSLQAGGMERVMSELADFFCKKNDVEVHLILYGIQPEIFFKTPRNLIIHKPVSVFNNKFRLLYTIGRLIYLRKTIKETDPHSILSFGEYWNSFVLLSLLGLRYPVYISDRCSPQKKFGTFHSQLRKWLYPGAKGIIAQTLKAKELYAGQFTHNNISIIGNPIRFYPNDGVKKEKIVLTIGRMIKSKNLDKLIELFCSINNPEWKFVIVGGDALKQNNMSYLKNLVTSLNADSQVVLTGYDNHPERFYSQSSIFVIASETEGFPNVIGEAMSAGLPVISFDCVAGPSEMITDGETGYLVDVNDYNSFKMRLERLITDEKLRERMGEKAKESIRKFSAEKIGAMYYDFITSD